MLSDTEQDTFQRMLEVEELPEKLVNEYARFKRMKDIVFPGTVTAECMALFAYTCLGESFPLPEVEEVIVEESAITPGKTAKKPKKAESLL